MPQLLIGMVVVCVVVVLVDILFGMKIQAVLDNMTTADKQLMFDAWSAKHTVEKLDVQEEG